MNEHQVLRGRRVLVVEDSYIPASHQCRWLEEAGATVVGPAATAARALELLESDAIDCAVIDINLDEGPVYDVAGKLTEFGVPFLFATGYDRSVIPEEFARAP